MPVDEYSTISPLENPWFSKLIKLLDVEIPDDFTKSFLLVNFPPSKTFISEIVFFSFKVTNFWVPVKDDDSKVIALVSDW